MRTAVVALLVAVTFSACGDTAPEATRTSPDPIVGQAASVPAAEGQPALAAAEAPPGPPQGGEPASTTLPATDGRTGASGDSSNTVSDRAGTGSESIESGGAAQADSAATAGDPLSGIAAVTPSPEMRIPANETLVSINTPTPTRTPTPAPTSTSAPGSAPMVGGCQVLPSNNPWNTDISAYPVHANSANFITSISAGGKTKLHPDWGGGGEYGIPFIVVPPTQPMTAINFTDYGDESDTGPYPIPLNAPIEGGPSSDGDRHVLAVRQGECKLYELYRAFPQSNRWDAGSGAVWPLSSNALRPEGWTSADAAGLPILPGLVRYDEVAAGQINHALRFTVWRSQRGYIHPATHFASSSTDPDMPPMGLRLRLKASYNISGYTGETRVVLEALRKYGMIVADNGSSWFITGAADPRWNDEDLNQLKQVPGSAFEVVHTGDVIN